MSSTEHTAGWVGLSDEEKLAFKALREPFPAEQIGKLPRVWCKACRDTPSKVCAKHERARCDVCGNNITTAHLHLDYVGHAATTDRLFQVDPMWTWEPMAVGPNGEPLMTNGGLWIRLTVLGVTRPGFGDGDSMKIVIGDAIRNAAMRFGVALDLWAKEDLQQQKDESEQKVPATSEGTVAPTPDFVPVPAEQRRPEVQITNVTQDDPGDWVMPPPSKHAGKALRDIPISYLDWYMANGKTEEIKLAIRAYRPPPVAAAEGE